MLRRTQAQVEMQMMAVPKKKHQTALEMSAVQMSESHLKKTLQQKSLVQKHLVQTAHLAEAKTKAALWQKKQRSSRHLTTR